MNYTVFFIDRGVLNHTGTMQSIDNLFYLYGEDKIVRYIIPISQVKYVKVD